MHVATYNASMDCFRTIGARVSSLDDCIAAAEQMALPAVLSRAANQSHETCLIFCLCDSAAMLTG